MTLNFSGIKKNCWRDLLVQWMLAALNFCGSAGSEVAAASIPTAMNFVHLWGCMCTRFFCPFILKKMVLSQHKVFWSIHLEKNGAFTAFFFWLAVTFTKHFADSSMSRKERRWPWATTNCKSVKTLNMSLYVIWNLTIPCCSTHSERKQPSLSCLVTELMLSNAWTKLFQDYTRTITFDVKATDCTHYRDLWADVKGIVNFLLQWVCLFRFRPGERSLTMIFLGMPVKSGKLPAGWFSTCCKKKLGSQSFHCIPGFWGC